MEQLGQAVQMAVLVDTLVDARTRLETVDARTFRLYISCLRPSISSSGS